MKEEENSKEIEFFFDFSQEKTYRCIIEESIIKSSQETIKSIDSLLNSIKTKYHTFQNKIIGEIDANTERFSIAFNIEGNLKEESPKVYQSFQNFASKKLMPHLDNILEVHKDITDSLIETFKLLESFLEVETYLYKEEPSKEFLSSNIEKIYNSWLFTKINFCKIDLKEICNNKDIKEDLKYFITKNTKNKFSKFIISKENKLNSQREEDKERDIRILRENKDNLKKLHVVNIDLIDNYFKSIEDNIVFSKLEKLKIINSHLDKVNLKEIVPECKSLVILNSRGVLMESIESLPLHIQRLSIDKAGLIDRDLSKILKLICYKESPLLNTIEYLSFANNNFRIVDFNQHIFQSVQLSKLKEIDFKKNLIYNFSFNPTYFQNLRCINVSKNRFSIPCFKFLDKSSIIVLESNNYYLTNKVMNEKYLSILLEKLKNVEYGFSYLSLSGMFNKLTRERFRDVQINYVLQISVKKLDLSFCGLDNKTLFEFFTKNKGFLCLRYLNLSGNQLTDEFFTLFTKTYKLQSLFTKLTHINLASNQIQGENFAVVFEFIQENKNLTKMNLMKNPFYKIYQAKKKEPSKKKEFYHRGANEPMDFILFLMKVNSLKDTEGGGDKKEARDVKIKFDVINKFIVTNQRDDLTLEKRKLF